ncbi:MAG: hypothetical protein GY943_15820 [Chloroflexi bacterium]|nr:hypothetical protein [Chloroflexota bacterium]
MLQFARGFIYPEGIEYPATCGVKIPYSFLILGCWRQGSSFTNHYPGINMGHVQQLFKLQTFDIEIVEKTKRLKAVLAAQKGSVALQNAKAVAEEMETAVSTLQTQHKDLSLELEGLNTKAKNSERRLYSGKVTNTKELADLQNEIESLGKRRDALEEEILETMVLLEEAQEQQVTADDMLAKITKSWKSETASLRVEQNELALRLHKLGGLRKEQAKSIPPRIMADYNNLRKKRGGVAISKLRVNQCLSCQLSVSANKVKEAREGKLVYCGGCGRILHPA